MPLFPARGTGAAAILLFSAQGALADLSAEDVWNDWKAYLSSAGYEVSGSESMSGTVLTVTGVTLEMASPDTEAASVISFPELRFEGAADGTVEVFLPQEFPMTFTSATEEEGELAGTLTYTHDGSPLLVSGDASEMTYDYASALVTVTLDSLAADGEAMPPETADFTLTLHDLVSKTIMTIADARSYDQAVTAASLGFELAAENPETGESGTFTGAMQGLSFEGSGEVPEDVAAADLPSLMAAGFGSSGTFNYAAGGSTISGTDGAESFEIATTSQGGTLGVALEDGRLAYTLQQQGTDVTISGTDTPFPLMFSMAEAAFSFAAPVTPSDEEQDFSLGASLREFAIPDALWSMIDPGNALPHDPATVVVGLEGKGRILSDVFDPAAMDALEDSSAAPGELSELTLKELLVTAAGAALSGTGSFTFDNDDTESFGGMPAPEGTANLKLTGANALIDRLTGMGLMSEQDAMGARMMLGLFAVPGEGEDTLTSTIEVRPDGQVLANGQRIK